MSDVDIDLVIVNYRTPRLLMALLESLVNFEPDCSFSVTVIDVDPVNASSSFIDVRSSRSSLSPLPSFSYISIPENIGYARACNLGAAATNGRNIALLNADTRFNNAYCIDRCVKFLDSNSLVGVVGPLQIDGGRSRAVTHGGIFGSLSKPIERAFKSINKKGLMEDAKAVSVSGSALFTKRSVWNEMHDCEIFLESFPDAIGSFILTQHFYEETGYNYHVQSHGYEVWYLGSAEMIHEWHKSSPPGTQSKHIEKSRSIFRDFCDAHGIDRP